MKLVILDRDGVINYDSDQFVKTPAEWKAIPGSLEAIARLTQAGFRVVVATNQSGIGRGLFDMDTLNAIHEKMHRAVQAVGGRIDAVFYCPHSADSNCDCRLESPTRPLCMAWQYLMTRRFYCSARNLREVNEEIRNIRKTNNLTFVCPKAYAYPGLRHRRDRNAADTHHHRGPAPVHQGQRGVKGHSVGRGARGNAAAYRAAF